MHATAVSRVATSPNGAIYKSPEMSAQDSVMVQRSEANPDDLEEGAMVVMYSSPGILVVVRQNGRYWDLEPLEIPEESGGLTLHFFPSEAVFTVVRKGKFIGFKSVAADGRTLQAVTAEDEAPLRVNNYNFGPWESWEGSGSGFVNKKWPQKSLGLEVHEIQTVSLDNLRQLERRTLKQSREMQKQIKVAESHRVKLERDLQELNRAKRRLATQHNREMEESRSRLDEALAAKQKLEVDGVQNGTRLRRQELQIHQLSLQRDAANGRVNEIESTHRSEERQLELLKEKYESELEALERSHQSEIEAMKREQTKQVDNSAIRANEEVLSLKQRLEQGEADRDRDVRRIQAESDSLIRDRTTERDQLKDENRRLAQALHIIQQKVQHGFLAVNREELPPFRNGFDERARSAATSPLQNHRYSPSLPRFSNRRSEDYTDNGVPSLERPVSSVDQIPTHFYDRQSLQPLETYSARSSSECHNSCGHVGAHVRRGDSRASDNGRLQGGGDDTQIGGGMLGRRHPPEIRRTVSMLQDPMSARYSTPLHSIDDRHSELSADFKEETARDEEEEDDEEERDLNTKHKSKNESHAIKPTDKDEDDDDDDDEDEEDEEQHLQQKPSSPANISDAYLQTESDSSASADVVEDNDEQLDIDTKSIDSDDGALGRSIHSKSSKHCLDDLNQPEDLPTESIMRSNTSQLLVGDQMTLTRGLTDTLSEGTDPSEDTS